MEQRKKTSASDPAKEQKRRQLYDRQVELLHTFLKSGAISPAQFDKSFRDLTDKMGYGSGDITNDPTTNRSVFSA